MCMRMYVHYGLCTLLQGDVQHVVCLMRMQASAVELLEVLLEETSEHSHKLAHGISQDLDVSIIIQLMDRLWLLQREWDEKSKYQLGDEIRRAIYRAFHVVRKMADYLAVEWKELKSNPSVRIQSVWVRFNC